MAHVSPPRAFTASKISHAVRCCASPICFVSELKAGTSKRRAFSFDFCTFCTDWRYSLTSRDSCRPDHCGQALRSVLRVRSWENLRSWHVPTCQHVAARTARVPAMPLVLSSTALAFGVRIRGAQAGYRYHGSPQLETHRRAGGSPPSFRALPSAFTLPR